MITRFGSPFDTLREIQRALDESLASDWLGRSTAAAGSYPPVNVFQQGDDLLVVAEMPGVAKADLEISVKRNQLRIAGKKRANYGDGISVHRQERSFGSFDRTFTMPLDIDGENVRAEYRDGILALSLSRAEHEKAKKIEIG